MSIYIFEDFWSFQDGPTARGRGTSRGRRHTTSCVNDVTIIMSLTSLCFQITNRYDIVLIQEIRDSSETAIYELLSACNDANSDPFRMVISDRLGRTSYVEQYAFFYR